MTTTTLTERQQDSERKSNKRAEGREIDYQPCVAPKRRAVLEADTTRWLRAFFPVRLSHPFTDQQREWIDQIETRMVSGGDKAIAAPRGEGKTTIAELVLLKAILTGKIRYAVLVAATGPHAKRSLRNIKRAVEKSSRLGRYYPEVSFPVQEMDRAPQRAKKQTCGGAYTDMRWETDVVTLPTMPDSRCSGSMISCHGLDSAIRGINEEGLRPDFVLIDDPETRESASSLIQIEAREEIIEKDLAGLGGPGEICGRLMLCTLQNPSCLSAKYTSDEKPWDGKRYKLLAELPTNKELWDHYLELQRKDPAEATAYYVANREAMDAGAVASNPYRFVADVELSPVQHFYNWVARIGWDAVLSEYQNDPTEEAGPQESGITEQIVRTKLNQRVKLTVPNDTQAVTTYIDLGKFKVHWVTMAWLKGASGVVVDYGMHSTSPNADDQKAVEMSLLSTLREWRDAMRAEPIYTDEGEARPIDVVLVDSGMWDTVVHQFVRESGGPFRASKGFGSNHGRSPFSSAPKNTKEHKSGTHWFCNKQPTNGVWLWGLDVDYWKRFLHYGFMVPTFNDDRTFRHGAISIFGDDAREHGIFARSIVSEVEVEEPIEGKGIKRYWKVIHSRENHYLDCAAGCAAASDMVGVKLMPGVIRAQPVKVDATKAPSRFRQISHRRGGGGFVRRRA